MDCKKSALHVDLIIKFGGSAITNKNELETLKEDSLNKAAELIRECYQKKLTCIVVHGAGSFGHHQAKEYKVNQGWKQFEGDQTNIDRVKRGFCLTRKSVTKLNHHVVNSLLLKDVPAVSISVCGAWETVNGTVAKYSLDSVKDILRNGFVPVLHGDCVLDSIKGCAILSGDTIIQTFSEAFTVHRVVFLTSVRGVFSSPPEANADACLLKSIDVYEGDRSKEQQNCEGTAVTAEKSRSTEKNPGDNIVMQNESTDVTGGMTLKFRTAVEIVRDSSGKTKVFICMIGSGYATDVCLYGQKQESDIADSGTEFICVP